MGSDEESGDGGEDDESGQESQEEGAESEMALVRGAHLSPDAPNVDVYVDGEAELEDVAYRDVSDYMEFEPGTYDVEVTEAGDDEEVIYEDSLEVEAGTYTLAAVGEDGEDNEPLDVEVFEDDTSDPGDDARLSVVHASPDAPTVDVTDDESGDALVEDLSFGGRESLEAASGDYTVGVRPADDDGDPVATFDVSLESGTVYTAFAVGYLEPDDAPVDEDFDLEVVDDSAGLGE
ncbi:MAG: DUF4397 domain-containing protein [Halohasta sp.]